MSQKSSPSQKFAFLLNAFGRPGVCHGLTVLVTAANFCLGQPVITQDDSLIIDSVRTEDTLVPVRALTPQRTQPHAQKAAAVSVKADTVPGTQVQTPKDIPVSVKADTLGATQIQTPKDSAISVRPDTVPPTQQQIVLPDSTETITPRNEEEVAREPVAYNLSPFSSDMMNAVGISLDYFDYAENPDLGDIFGPGYLQDSIVGFPKSTEYGLLFGFDYQGAMREHGKPILFRPSLDVQIGLHQTYDGSTQGEPIVNRRGDTVGIQFFPETYYKNNYFVQAGLDIGYCRTHALLPFYVYSGMNGRLWYRDEVADTTSYANQITNSELYYWFSLPIGIALSMPVSPKFCIGIDASLDLMFFGQMQAFLSGWAPDTTFSTVFPAVTLGNRVGYRVELSFMYKSTGGTIFRFVPYVNVYSFGKSESETAKAYSNGQYVGSGDDQIFGEPASSSVLFGTRFQIVFLSPRTGTI